MESLCRLRQANGEKTCPCEEGRCVYWRLADHVGVAESGTGCAIQHFELLDGGADIATWLMSVKDRVERPRTDA